jgi:hypothetical protein
LYLLGDNINWTYTGALPTDLTSLYLSGTNINWTYTGALPTDLTYLSLSGNNINWTGWGLQPAWTAPARVLTALNFLVNIGNVPTASVAETQNWIDRAADLANAGTATLTFHRTSTVGDGVDTTLLTNLGYTVVLGV